MLSAEFKEFIDYKDKKLTAIRTKYDPKLYIYKNSYPNKALVFTDRGEMIPNYDNYSESHLEKYYHGLYNIGTPESRWRAIYLRKIWACDVTNSPRYFGYNYQVHFDRDQMNNVKRITNSSTITKQDLLDFIMDKVKVYEYSSKVIDELHDVDEGDYGSQMYLGLLSDDMVTKKSNSNWSTSKLASRIIRGVVTADTNNDGETTEDDLTTYFVYNLPALVCALIGAFQQHVATGGGSSGKVFDDDVDIDFDDNDPNDKEDSGGSGGSGGSGSSGGSGGGSGNISGGFIEAERIDVEGEVNVFGELYVTEKIKCELTTETNTLKVNKIEFSDGSKMITAGTGSGNTPGSGNYATVEYVDSQVGAVLELKPAIIDLIELKPAIIDFIELKPAIIDLIENGSGDSGGGSTPSTGNTFDTITVRKIIGPDRGEDQYKLVEFEDGIMTHRIGSYTGAIDITADTHVSMHSGLNVEGDVSVDGYVSSWNINGSSDKSLKENIRYIDAPTTYSVTHNDDLLEKADLYDFIVNQINLCEYNFINDDREKIGFIANDYEGTKVGDKIVSRDGENGTFVYNINNLLFSIIGALQEEARVKDEKIATLEDRLARIEAMLGINNNDN